MVQIPSWHYFDSAEVKGVCELERVWSVVTKKVPVVILN